jgi:leucyl-tRNA synthetase
LVESEKEYPVSSTVFYHGFTFGFNRSTNREIVMKDERTIKQLDGKTPNKVIIVPGKIINLVGSKRNQFQWQ